MKNKLEKEDKKIKGKFILSAVLCLLIAFVANTRYKENPLQCKAGKKPDEKICAEKTETSKPKELDISEFYNPINWKAHSKQIKQMLNDCEVSSVENMRDVLHTEGKNASFSGNVYKVKLKNGLEAVFKTNSEGNFPKCMLEEAAYDISVETGIGFVPPTVHVNLTCDFDKTGNSETKTGFLSLFVQTKSDLISLSKKEFDNLFSRAGEKEAANFKIFNFVFGNWDVGPHNILIYEREERGKLNCFPILIDNEGISNIKKIKYGEIPFIRFYRVSDDVGGTGEFPFDLAKPSSEEAKHEVFKSFGFTPPGREHNYVIWGGFYWAQFIDSYWGSPSDITDLIYSDFLPAETKSALEQISEDKLLRLLGYTSANVPDSLREVVHGILNRRDILLSRLG